MHYVASRYLFKFMNKNIKLMSIYNPNLLGAISRNSRFFLFVCFFFFGFSAIVKQFENISKSFWTDKHIVVVKLKSQFSNLVVYPSTLAHFRFCIKDWVSVNERHRPMCNYMLSWQLPLEACFVLVSSGVLTIHLWHFLKVCFAWRILC